MTFPPGWREIPDPEAEIRRLADERARLAGESAETRCRRCRSGLGRSLRVLAVLALAVLGDGSLAPLSPTHLRRAWNHRHLLALQSVAIVLPPRRAAAPDRDACSAGSCCRQGGPYWPVRRGATFRAPAPAWNGCGGVRAT